ncbi:MAG TPA: hypothetical protein VL501_07295, partial [Pyrinomonadaceae bacterium]|nr:hypothetical protein [Pyrinomonadaceae bacterium]
MPTLNDDMIGPISDRLMTAMSGYAGKYPGESAQRQPVHTVYGGAHLFKSDTAKRLGALGVRSFEAFAANAEELGSILGIPTNIRSAVYECVAEKLGREAVEDFRIDFEDGYGIRPDAEEDGHAESAAREVAKGIADGTLPPFIGIRIKTFSAELHKRAFRTLD